MKAILKGTSETGLKFINVVSDDIAAAYLSGQDHANGLRVEAVDISSPVEFDSYFKTGGLFFVAIHCVILADNFITVFGPFVSMTDARTFGDKHKGIEFCEFFEAQPTSIYSPWQLQLKDCISLCLSPGINSSVFAYSRDGVHNQLKVTPIVLRNKGSGLDVRDLEKYEMVLFDARNQKGDEWKHVFLPQKKTHVCVCQPD